MNRIQNIPDLPTPRNRVDVHSISSLEAGASIEAFACEMPRQQLLGSKAIALSPNLIGQTGKHRVYNFEVEEHHTYIADGIRVHNESVHYTVQIDGAPYDVEAPEGSEKLPDGTIIGPDGRVIVWKDKYGNYGQTNADQYYSENLLNQYGVVENGVARTTFSGTARAFADALGFDGSFGLDNAYAREDEGNERANEVAPTSTVSNSDGDDGSPLAPTTSIRPVLRDDVQQEGFFKSIAGVTFKEFIGVSAPIILDLDRDGIEVMAQGGTYFDVDGDGFIEETSWVAPDDGFLVVDLNENGVVDQTSELVLSRLRDSDQFDVSLVDP